MDVIVFAVVFIWLDRTQDKILADFDSLRPWLICLVFNNGEADKCLNVIGSVVVPFPIICLVLILFSVSCLLMVTDWTL